MTEWQQYLIKKSKSGQLTQILLEKIQKKTLKTQYLGNKLKFFSLKNSASFALKFYWENSNFTEKNSNSIQFTQMNRAKIVINFERVALKFHLVPLKIAMGCTQILVCLIQKISRTLPPCRRILCPYRRTLCHSSKIRKVMSKSGNKSVFITFSNKTVVLTVEIDVAQ